MMSARDVVFALVAVTVAACAAPLPEPAAAPAAAPGKSGYPAMAPIEQYRIATAEEVAFARSAAPPSVSDHAEVQVLGEKGYSVAEKGTNGFVCIVERSWANDFDAPELWNPKVRAPICFNRAAARSVLPTYLKRTEWVLAGTAKEEMMARTKAAIASGEIRPPEVGSMCFMMSPTQYLQDDGGRWHPHLMFFLPKTEHAEWGADLPGSPLFAQSPKFEPLTIFMSPVRKWSDGTSDMPHDGPHK